MKIFLGLTLLGLLLVSVECLQKLSLPAKKGIPEKREKLRVVESKTGRGMERKRNDDVDKMKLPPKVGEASDENTRSNIMTGSRLRDLLEEMLEKKREEMNADKEKRLSAAKFSQLCYDAFGNDYSYLCADGSYCIPQRALCDGSGLCQDSSDEAECQIETNPNENEENTGNNDGNGGGGGKTTCEAGSDLSSSSCASYFAEYPCGCLNGGLCLATKQVCNGLIECSDKSDEAGCDYGFGSKCGDVQQEGNSGLFAGGKLSSELKNQLLEAHKFFRCLHGAASLRWDETLEASATGVAQDNANKGFLDHSDGILSNGEKYGENLAYNGFSSSKTITGFGFTQLWYDEIEDYDYNNPGFSSATGHFTQVVWKSSTSIGCGMAVSGSNYFLACQYQPPGNYQGQFGDEVLPPIY